MDITRIEEEWDEYKSSAIRPNVVYFAERIATLARNEALEEAALISDSLAGDWSFAANRISKNIRALKEPK